LFPEIQMIGLRNEYLGLASLAFAFMSLVRDVSAAPADQDLFLRPEDMHTVLFGSLDAGRSVFLTAGVKRTLTGPLDRSGFVAMEVNGSGLTRERFEPTPGLGVIRFTTETASLLGYQWAGDGVFAALYAGPEIHHEQLTVAAMAGQWSKPRLGLRGLAELWLNPSRDTLLTATAQAGSTRGSLYGRVSAGYRLWRSVYVGPEAGFYATQTYNETKLGAHVTGLSLGIFQFRFSGGVQRQDDRRHPSPYVGVASWIRL
jgi:hypothetical protein